MTPARLEDLDPGALSTVWLPLSRLLHRAATAPPVRRPFLIAVAGSVAVGKSTIAAIVGDLVARWPESPRVALVSTDGFLHANRVLEERGIAHRKGYPESYDRRRLAAFLGELKSGARPLAVPVYSHVTYDVVEGRHRVLDDPDVVVVEGLNVLQPGDGPGPTISDFFDFSIYVDAPEALIEQWYVERFAALRAEARHDPGAFFHRFAGLDADELADLARQVWRAVNGPNLRDNIAPTRALADVVVEKGPGHRLVALHVRDR